jgi:tetratricopeptide (TPR) repeat protein
MTEYAIETIIIDPPELDAEGPPEQAERVKAWAAQMEPEAPWKRAELLARMGLRASALETLQAEVANTSDHGVRARCYFVAGRLREQFGQFEAASRCYQAVTPELLDDEDRYFAHNNLGYCLNRLGRHAEAEAECRRAIATDAALFNAHKNLGIALERTGRLAEAAVAYRTAALKTKSDERPLRHLRVLLANHPEIAREQPELAREAEALRRSSRARQPQVSQEYTGPREEDVRQLLSGIRIAEAIESNGVQVFGLYWDPPKSADYATLDDALSGGIMEITEIGEQGTVPALHVVNRSDGSVLLTAGEQLVGAKQNRVLNASFMIGAHRQMPVPVTCVEQGRWAYRSRSFSTSGTSSHVALRMMMSKHAHASYRLEGRPESDQVAVWMEVNRKLRAHDSESPSHALHEAYESQEPRLKEAFDHLAPGEGWSGAVFAFGGSIIGLDLFDKPSTLSKLWPKLVRAYAIDALESERAGSVDRSQVEAWVRGVSRTAVESFASPGIGTDVRLEGDRLVGALLLVEDVPVHLEVFADDND